MDGPTRFIQVTNDNSLVKYYAANNSKWTSTPKTNPLLQVGNMGAPVSSFLQGISDGLNHSISFTFEGLEITVMTTFLVSANMSPEPSLVSCKVDNEFLVTDIPQLSQNNWPICNGGSLTDGEHTLTVNIGSFDILFDYILYTPSPAKMLDPTDVSTRIEASDPSVTYLGGFVIRNDTGLTRFTSGNMTVSFFGQQLTWYGAYYSVPPPSESAAEYAIDGGALSEYISLVAEIPSNFTTLLNQPYFQTEVLPQGPHQVTVTYLGEGNVPLGLSFVVIQNFSNIAPSPIFNGTIAEVPTTTSLSIASTGSRNDRDTIIGIAFGVGGFLLIIILFLFRRLKRCGLNERKPEEQLDISSNRVHAMQTISTVLPDSFNVHDSGGQSRNGLLTQHRGPIFATGASAGSTEALFNSYAITPIQIPSHPVANFGGSGSTPSRAPAEVFLETSTLAAPNLRSSFTARPEERHADSGVRLNWEILLYNEANSEWSLPPPYTHD